MTQAQRSTSGSASMTYHCFFPNADLVREVHLNLEHSPRLAARVSARDVTALRDARAVAVIDGLAPLDCDPLLASLDPDDPLGRLVGPHLPHGPGCPCEPLP
ncbi:hypothetical protein Q7C18_14135 [Nesterenkonia sp. CL21]|uniref:hypothetical protein n=1 Tax=Nesterenkonia sp. CL21 TaxID=3064894 RepID=UPI00287AED85|nr:hypothetical protein [Nesterenkonia sp. CL21]MDS2173842.1 hypothetical protein [Nesterenkonia sp. CL21]